MKLLHVIAGSDQESGGPIEALLRISEVLVRDGHQVAVVTLEDEAESQAQISVSDSRPRTWHQGLPLQPATRAVA